MMSLHKTVLLACIAGCSGVSIGHTQPPIGDTPAAVWLAAGDAELARMRGGFVFANGLSVSFGLTRTTFINGLLVGTTTLQLGDMNRATSGHTPDVTAPAAPVVTVVPAGPVATTGPANTQHAQVIQNGPGNTIDPGVLQVPLATFIQNTLNNQSIQNQTVIQATTNSLGILRGMQFQSGITDSYGSASWYR